MKVKAITMSLLALMVSQSVNASYTVFYPLSDRPLNFVVNGIDGSVSLDKNSINRGQSANIIWNYKYVSKIDIENLGTYNERTGSASVNPLKSTSYDVTIYNGEKSKKEKLYLTVNQPEPEISFVADRYQVGVGESVNLSWDVKNIDSAMIDNNIGEINSRSSIKVTPSDDTTYKLTATGYFGEKNGSKLLTIDVIKNSIVEFLNVNKNKFTVGEEAVFNWKVSNSEGLELYPYGKVDKTKNSASVVLTKIGSFDYTLKSTSFNNSIQSSNPVSLNVYGNPVINSFTVNNSKSVNVETGDTIAFNWTADNNEKTQLDGRDVTGNGANLKATTENKIYQLDIINGAGKKVSDSVTVNVVEPVDITTFIAPSNVFANEPFTLSWSGSGVDKYTLSGQSGSGVSSNIDMGVNTSTLVTPTNTGTFTYNLKANNLAEKTSVKDTNVVVESIPTFTGLTVNGQTSITVAPSTPLTFATTGASMGTTLKGRNSSGTADLSLPSTANTNEGTTNYYASVNKVLNGVSKYSEIRSVMVTVVNTPTLESITGPNVVFNNSAFTLSWNGTNASNYKIKSNNAASGISTSDMDLSTSTSKSITPTVAGTYNYTITVTNAAGVTATSTKQVVVENLPTFTDFTVNGQQTITVAPSSSLNFVGSGFSTGATLQGRNSAGTTNATLPTVASSTAGTTNYYAAAVKTINGVTNYSGIKTVSVVVVDAPTITSVTAPSSVFANAAFTMSWAGSNAVNYTIKSNNAASGIPTSEVDLDNTTSKSITPTVAGNYTYIITATNAAGVSTASTKQVVVEPLPTFTGFTVNGSTSITVSPSTALSFSGSGFSTGSTLQGRNSAGTTNATLPTTASATAGTTNYYAAAVKTINGVTNYSGVRMVSVIVVDAPTITSMTAPTSVFANAPFTMSWAGNNATNYSIKANSSTSGIATSDVDLGTATNKTITPTTAGTYTYTLTATNEAGVTTTSTKQVIVEALPTFTGFTVNGLTSITVSPSATLTFAGNGFSSGAVLQGRDSAGTNNVNLPTTASSTAGITTYYAAATKTINGVTNNSGVRSVSVTVVNTPVITSITAPSPVFEKSAFTMSWAATNAVSYTIKSNNAASGISTTDVDLQSASSVSITPTVAGTYTYTLTATNAAGVTATSTKQVIVETIPTFTGFTVNGSTSVTVAPSTPLSFAGNGFSNGATLQGRDSTGSTNAALPASANTTAGTTTYYASAYKTLNGATNYSAVRSVTVTVVDAPVMSAITAPTSVFMNAPFTMSWTATGASNYTIKSDNATSGIATTNTDIGTATSRSITPTAAGTYVYTVTATNSVGVSTNKTVTVVVEALPSFTGFSVNNVSSVNVAPSAALSFVGTGFSTGSTLQGRNSAGTANATLPATASSTAGNTVYYAAAAKTLNGVTNYSAVKSVSVVVVNAPTITSFTAPSNVFANESFTMSWVGTDIINYKIKSNNVASGISVSDLDVGSATSTTIRPTSAGTYTYTLTGTSSTGATVTKTTSVSVGNSYLRIVNPQSSSGIYNVTDGKGGTFPVYVDMSMDGGYWLLITRWTSYPSSLAEHTFSNVVVSGQSLLTYTNDTTNYPVVPSGYTNSSTRALFNSANTSWTSVYGQWQSFNLFSNGAVLNSNGFSANTPLGTKTFYAVVTGWAIDGTTSAPMSSVFGLWTAYGNGGACGGATRAAPTKICAAMSNNLQANHLDAVSVKSLYIKASN